MVSILLPLSEIYLNMGFKRKKLYDLIRKLTPALDLKDKVKVDNNIEQNYVLHHPVAIVFIVGDASIALSESSAQYASYNLDFGTFSHYEPDLIP